MEQANQVVGTALTGALARRTKGVEELTTPPLARQLLERFLTLGDPQLEMMKRAAERLCAEVQARAKPRWLTLLGNSGAGKSLISRCVYQFVKERGRYYRMKGATGEDVVQWHETFWANWRTDAREMRSGDFSIVDLLCTSPEHRNHEIWFAVIDDLGASNETSRSYLLNAIDSIADARIGRWTMWTSNLTLGQIGDLLDPRIASRMIRDGNEVIQVDVPDFNLRNPK